MFFFDWGWLLFDPEGIRFDPEECSCLCCCVLACFVFVAL